MTGRKRMTSVVDRDLAAAEAAAASTDDALTPYQKLLRAAETGRFEALVRAARPAKPLAMVTPQEREAALRATGRWPASREVPKPAPQPASIAKPPPDLSPNEQYLAEHSRWRGRGPHDTYRHARRECLTDYDPLADTDREDEEL
jgi:hypothetical protein